MKDQMSQEAVVAKVQAGFSGGPFFKSPNLAPKMTIVDGYEDSAVKMVQGASFPQPTPDDTWNNRRKSS